MVQRKVSRAFWQEGPPELWAPEKNMFPCPWVSLKALLDQAEGRVLTDWFCQDA